MNIDCLNDIISDRLAIHIDVSDINSWNLNSGFTSVSLTKWANAKSDNINLLDFGLTAYDNGRVNNMLDNLSLNPNSVYTTLYRVGNNNATGGTFYDDYQISGITTGTTVGNYFELNGGYLQGFFKLQGENYETLSPRFGEGITIENILRIDPDSSGIFYLMGARAEDKYNPFFSGETAEIKTNELYGQNIGPGEQAVDIVQTAVFSGVTTSKNTYLNAFLDETVQRNAFADFADATQQVPTQQPQDSTYDNIISFEITQDKRIGIKRITSDGLIDNKISPNTITATGWTIITQVFTPDTIITDPAELKCAPRRKGILSFYVNGRLFWQLPNFDEYYFVGMKNDSEKVIGVPYNISWGGGSFGLKHSWHYDLMTYDLYSGETQQYINGNFEVTANPLYDDACDPIPPIVTGATGNSIALIANNTTFMMPDDCDPNSGTTITVMQATYSGLTGQSLTQYFIQYDQPIELISNRDYDFSVDVYNDGIFEPNSISSISLVVYGTNDLNVVNEIVYKKPITAEDLNANAPYPIFMQEFEYLESKNNLLIFGTTGYPVVDPNNLNIMENQASSNIITGEDQWLSIKSKIETKFNSGKGIYYVGILLESDNPISEIGNLYIKDFKYKGSDILNQDSTKSNLLVEQNFDSSYIGAIQKLRVYDIAFNTQQVLANARYESINNPNYNLNISRGGRIIYR